jgi:hypothetical protein
MLWILIVPDMLQPGDLLSRTLTSLAMARLGRINQDLNLAVEASEVFGTALNRL